MPPNEPKHTIHTWKYYKGSHGNSVAGIRSGACADKWPHGPEWGVTRIQSSCINIHALDIGRASSMTKLI